MLTSERLPQTKQMSCGLSLTTSHSAHNTACCSATAFRGWPAASKLPAFDWFITGPWEEVLHTEHFAGDCQGVRMAHVGHSVFILHYESFLIQSGIPKRASERQFEFLVCCELLTKCLIADLRLLLPFTSTS
jgi:hypothetical protein